MRQTGDRPLNRVVYTAVLGVGQWRMGRWPQSEEAVEGGFGALEVMKGGGQL